jgi:hypothetical protein
MDSPTVHKSVLMTTQLCTITDSLHHFLDHGDMLFLSMFNTGFEGLLQLGEMAVSDSPKLPDCWKVVLCSSLTWLANDFEFFLLAHKLNIIFKRNHNIIDAPDPQPIMAHYISSHNLHLHLWLCSNGSFLVHRPPELFLPSQHCRQSMHAGEATSWHIW